MSDFPFPAKGKKKPDAWNAVTVCTYIERVLYLADGWSSVYPSYFTRFNWLLLNPLQSLSIIRHEASLVLMNRGTYLISDMPSFNDELESHMPENLVSARSSSHGIIL